MPQSVVSQRVRRDLVTEQLLLSNSVRDLVTEQVLLSNSVKASCSSKRLGHNIS